jgi:alanine racemase
VTAARSPHRAWIEVDHLAIRSNLAALRARAPGSEVIAVVKADAYGHGDVAVARTLVAAGVEQLAVATVDEGLRLRDAGIE